MVAQVRVVKKSKDVASMRVTTHGDGKTERQCNRDMVGVIKSWIEEFQLRASSRSKVALVPLNK